MRHYRTQTLHGSLWASLPLELLSNVISQTIDLKTLDCWCEATTGSRNLHEAALRARWRSVMIDDRDLIPAPGDDEVGFRRIQKKLNRKSAAHHWGPVGKMVYALLSSEKAMSRLYPANYVQKLVFDFRMLRYWEDSKIQHVDDPYFLMPTLKALEHTLSLLNGQFQDLRLVTCHGDTPQVLLEFIAKEAVKIQCLEIRTLGAYGRLQVELRDIPSQGQNPTRCSPLQWTALSALHQLETLDIHHLSNHETEGLHTVLPSLFRLQSLTLACENQEHHSDDYVNGGCALSSLFGHMFHTLQKRNPSKSLDERCSTSFPPNLLSLTLIDECFFRLPALSPPLETYSFGGSLSHLHVDVGNVKWISTILDGFTKMTLNSLSMPGDHRDHFYINNAITGHFDCLNTVKLVRAWTTDGAWINKLNEYWQDTHAVQELVLGTRNPSWYIGFADQWKDRVPEPSLSTYLCGFEWDDNIDVGRWGSEIRRIRIDHIDLVDLDISILSESFYSHLKILMLQPGKRTQNFINHDCEAVDEILCCQLARRIVERSSPSLSVVVINNYWYWICKDLVGSERHDTLWTFSDAKADLKQNQLMSLTLSKADLDFLACSKVPFFNDRNLKEWGRNRLDSAHPHDPSSEMLHQWNYLTFLPLSEQEFTGTRGSM